MNKQVQNWLDSASYDFETAEHMLQGGRYIYAIFFCHLALEKLLKASVQQATDTLPPRTHNLRHLAGLSSLELPPEIFEFLSKLSDVSIPTRYPEDLNKMLEAYTRPVVGEYVEQTRKAFEWIRESLKPSPGSGQG